jgi:hypothetical protein
MIYHSDISSPTKFRALFPNRIKELARKRPRGVKAQDGGSHQVYSGVGADIVMESITPVTREVVKSLLATVMKSMYVVAIERRRIERTTVGVPDWCDSERWGSVSLRSLGKTQLREHTGPGICGLVCDLHSRVARWDCPSDCRLYLRQATVGDSPDEGSGHTLLGHERHLSFAVGRYWQRP